MRTIWNWIVGEVRTVEHIITDFTNTVKELEQHAVAKIEHATKFNEAVQAATAARDAAAEEAAKAVTVANKIKSLIAG